MSEPVKLYYKTCRENAKLTQEQAILYLDIADVSTLSKYENGHIIPDQRLVSRMVATYRVPSLAMWHIVHTNPDLSRYLPEITELRSEGDVYLQGSIASDLIMKHMEDLKRIMSVEADIKDDPETGKIKIGVKKAVDKAMSIVTYLDDKTS